MFHLQKPILAVLLVVLLAACPSRQVVPDRTTPPKEPAKQVVLPPIPPQPKRLTVKLLDVNQGLSLLVVTPSGNHAILIDAGGQGMGTKVVLPALRAHGLYCYRAPLLMAG